MARRNPPRRRLAPDIHDLDGKLYGDYFLKGKPLDTQLFEMWHIQHDRICGKTTDPAEAKKELLYSFAASTARYEHIDNMAGDNNYAKQRAINEHIVSCDEDAGKCDLCRKWSPPDFEEGLV